MSARARAAAAALLWLSACPDQVDRTAKQRIFSPEEPPRARLAAREPLPVDQLADDADLTYRVLTMGAAEAFERLGPFRYSASASFEWTYGKDSVSLSEKRTLEQASASEYALHTENSRDGGLDLVRLSDRAFARAKYHKFRERKRDRGQSDLVRDDVFGALHSAEALMGNKLALQRDRTEDLGGRKARRFSFMIAKQALRATGPDPWKLPPVQYPAGGPDQPTKRRADFANLRHPRSVEGEVWVDVETGVPLRVKLAATISAPGDEKDDFATLVLKIESQLEPLADKPKIAAPDDYLPDQDRPEGVAAALARFEIERADGGTPTEAKPKAPDGDETPEE